MRTGHLNAVPASASEPAASADVVRTICSVSRALKWAACGAETRGDGASHHGAGIERSPSAAPTPAPSVAAHVIQKQQSPTRSRSCIAKHFAGVKNPFHKFTGACFVQVSIGQTDDHKPAGSSLPTSSWTLSDSQNLGENMSKG